MILDQILKILKCKSDSKAYTVDVKNYINLCVIYIIFY